MNKRCNMRKSIIRQTKFILKSSLINERSLPPNSTINKVAMKAWTIRNNIRVPESLNDASRITLKPKLFQLCSSANSIAIIKSCNSASNTKKSPNTCETTEKCDVVITKNTATRSIHTRTMNHMYLPWTT